MARTPGADYRELSRLWTPTAEQYAHLGRMQVEDERFRENYERIADGLAVYMRDAMAAYARRIR
ncbi:TipAS antibiotic-recognition domain-containing protein [Nonomuraea wenchangensis]|uniref:TipAS antibiotic-recognition domain-containing protein n=1 Tax=Nonomuraea wenchangensis TaxID=568860 RepID=A0A1I0LGN3_9ACTN|nr:TipAS antibiotic-recognition domain-containing protein [Nonomuraea wenchangensis]SEU39268.1 TipAS antibiotic-recognition domain-containing protein [Nonomuraea wenchangensis]